MVHVSFRDIDGSIRNVVARDGFTVMEAAIRNGVPGILAECGGACSCATCHVMVDQDWFARVGPPGPDEAELLAFAVGTTSTSRLSCQIRLSEKLDGLTVSVPAAQR